jgi:hypothetical protein
VHRIQVLQMRFDIRGDWTLAAFDCKERTAQNIWEFAPFVHFVNRLDVEELLAPHQEKVVEPLKKWRNRAYHKFAVPRAGADFNVFLDIPVLVVDGCRGPEDARASDNLIGHQFVNILRTVVAGFEEFQTIGKGLDKVLKKCVIVCLELSHCQNHVGHGISMAEV